VTRSNARSWQGRNHYPWRITTDAPTIVNLRQDPFERTPSLRGQTLNDHGSGILAKIVKAKGVVLGA
jgi:hypothetical protein